MATTEFQCFVAEVDDVPLYFQIVKLEKQCYVWVGAGAAKLTSLYAAMPTKLVSRRWAGSNFILNFLFHHLLYNNLQDSVPSVTSLLPMSADDTTLTMAQRIGKLHSVNSSSFSLPPPAKKKSNFFALFLSRLAVHKVGIPIVLSVNLPSDSGSLQLAAERRIIEELQKL
jgi:hypothetical protein